VALRVNCTFFFMVRNERLFLLSKIYFFCNFLFSRFVFVCFYLFICYYELTDRCSYDVQ